MGIAKQDGPSCDKDGGLSECGDSEAFDQNDFGNFNRGVGGESLQDAFLKFKRARQKKLKEKCLKKRMNENERSEDMMKELRIKFVEQAKRYLGVPYAKRYHEPGSSEYEAPLFLDCCGLVRKVLRDLRKDFGFYIGPWNQAYMFDTLPITIDNVEDMKPGDLVFVSGIFYKPQFKKQRHNMVHVEIWAGDNEKTIGARWKKGRLQIHDSFKYVSKSYHSMVYHFKSIDTWLKGICKSFCPDHVWQLSSFTPGEKSIFSIEETDEDAESCVEQTSYLVDHDVYLLHERLNSNVPELLQDSWRNQMNQTFDKTVTQDVISHPNGKKTTGSNKREVATNKLYQLGKGPMREKSPNDHDDDDQSNSRRPTRPLCRPNPSYSRLNHKSPTFYIGGHNGGKMVEATLTSLGWRRVHDDNDRNFYLKWVECKKNLDYTTFKEGEQLVNHVPNGNLLTTKIGLLTSLQDFERVTCKLQTPTSRSKTFQMKDFFPETYKLQRQTEIEHFIHHIYQDGEIWICKPTGSNQGKGIFLIRNKNDLEKRFEPKQEDRKYTPFLGRVIQRYISNPLLLNGFKADVRTYMLIAGTCPYMVFYHGGYVRLSVVPYSLTQQDLHAHLTNQYIQKKHPLYEQVKEETVWSLEKLQEYIHETYNKEGILPHDWVHTTFTKRMQEIMLKCFESVRHKLERKLGFFDLLGFDFMLDENFKVWLIEVNVNPALHTNCKILSEVIPDLVDGTLKLVIEVFEKSRDKEKLTPLENLGKFQLLYNGSKK